jgi:hypothetical protein
MNKKILPWLILFCAIGLGATAAYYSIIGLSKLFAGVATAVIIMASFLELSKLTLATLLHSYWDKLNLISKIYYIISLVILSLITSMGVYGMLSSGYQDTANKLNNIESQTQLIETKRNNIQKQLNIFNAEKQNIDESINNLRNGLSNNIIQYQNSEGQIITTTSSSNRKALEKQLDQALERQKEIDIRIDDLNSKIFEYETSIIEVKTSNDLAGEIGPLKYISNLTSISMDKIINWLLLVIIFVFDPLAISLVIAANFAFEQIKPKLKENIYGEIVPISQSTSIQKPTPQAPPPLPNPIPQHNEEIKTLIKSLQSQLIPGLSDFRRNKINNEISQLKSKLSNDDMIINY